MTNDINDLMTIIYRIKKILYIFTYALLNLYFLINQFKIFLMKKMNFYFNSGISRATLTFSFLFLWVMAIVAQPFTLTGSVSTNAVAPPTCGTTNVINVTLASTNAQGAFTVDAFLVNNTTNVTVATATALDNILPKSFTMTAPAPAAGASQEYRVEYRIWDAVNFVYLTPRVVLGNATITTGPLPGIAAIGSGNPAAANVSVATCTANLPAAGNATNTFSLTTTACYTLANNATAAVQGGLNVAVTNVSATELKVVASGIVPIGTYPITVNYTSNGVAQVANFTVTVKGQTTLACVGQVNVTLPSSCSYTLSYAEVLTQSCPGDNDLIVEVLRNGVWVTGTLGSADINKTLQYRVRNTLTGAMCWGNVLVEDKTAPIIICPANITLTCSQAGSVSNLNVTGEFNGATNATAGGPTGTVTECSKYEQSYTDAGTINACTGGTITRTWIVKDQWGNTSAPCVQTITVSPAPAFTPPATLPTVTKDCQDVTAAGKAAILAGTDADRYTLTGCGLSVQPNPAVTELQLCGSGYKVIRRWTVLDMCAPAAEMVKGPVVQVIEVVDRTAPAVSVTYQNYSTDADGDCRYMNGMSMTRTLQKLKLLTPVTADFTTPVKGTTTLASKPVITLVPRADANVCDMAPIFFTLTGSDVSCGNGSITYSSNDSRIRFNGATTATVAGNATVNVTATIMKSQGVNFTVIVTDACGNTNRQDFTVDIKDNVAPQVVCVEETRATLGSDGTVRIYTPTFNNRSSDNCGIVEMHVRRATIGSSNTCGAGLVNNPDACWGEYVDFNCSDLGRTDIMVVLRAVDAAGNYSDCMVNVTVDDKTKPICMNQPQINKVCTDADLSSYKTLFVQPAAFDNCKTTLVRFWDDKELTVSCGKGEVTRSWKFVDCTGDTTNNSVTCTQKVVVTSVLGFTVPKIQDQELACSSIDIEAVKEADRRTIINSANLTTFNGGKTCSAPVVEVEHWLYSSTQYCKIYRIRYTIIDHCDPFYDYLNAPIIAGTNCGIMYDPRTGAPYFYGTPDANCSNIQSVPAGFDLFGRATPGHIVIYERLIKINDRTAPVSTVPTAPDKCTTWNGSAQVVNTGCTFNYRTILTGDDNCGTTTAASDPSKLYFMWRAVVKNVPGLTAGTQLGAGNGATASAMASSTVSLTNLAFGTYTICYRVTDLCGNMSQEYCYDIEGADCKAPEILVHTKVVELAGVVINGASTGMARLNYEDIKNRITDNCSGDLTNDAKVTIRKGNTNTAAPTGSEVGNKSVMYGCAEAGTTQSLQVWAVDAAGNWNYVVTTITVQDNIGICTPPIAIFGAARTESNAVVNNVTVSASANGTAVASTSVANGSFNITMQAASNVQVRAAKNNNDDATSGVTTFDIAKVSQHVLDVAKLATPYKMIAADVDKSGEIDANDMLHLRRFILKITPSLPGGNFRFIDKAYTFRDASNPFGEDFPEVVNIASLSANTAANFVAVKLGDVNDSYAALAPRSTRTLSFVTNDMDIVAGNEYTVNIAADKMDAAAFQGTFSFNGAKVKSVKAGDLNNMTDGNFGIFANAVTTSWNGKTQDASEVLAITFVANKSGKLSEMLTVNSELTQAVANDAAGNEMNVNLKFNTGKVAGGEFALYQNQPNPVANETTIGFNLPKDGQARLTITAVDGKVAKVINGNYKAGYNTITVNKSDLNASGVFYYRLETADHSASKKMVIIE